MNVYSSNGVQSILGHTVKNKVDEENKSFVLLLNYVLLLLCVTVRLGPT